MSGVFRIQAPGPFRVRNFRYQWPADLLTSWAFEMEALILGWYILVETGSVVLLTVFWALLFAGTLIAPMFGVVGDRIGHRNLLATMRAFYMTLAVVMAVLAFTGALRPLYVFIIAALMGIVRPSDLGVRGALTATSMPHEHLIGAMSVQRITTDSSRIAGALAGTGLFAVFGLGPAYVMTALFYALSALLTLRVAQQVEPLGDKAVRMSPWSDLKEGIVYAWSSPKLQSVLWIAFLVNLTAFPLLNGLLPYVAKEIYLTDQTGLGTLVAAFAFGALFGSLALPAIGRIFRLERVVVAATLFWHALLLIFAQTTTLAGGMAILLIIGFVQSLTIVALAVILMQTASPRFRGRIMGVRMLAIYSLPLGLLIAGPLIGRIGFHTTATLYAAVGLVFTLVIAVRWRAHLWTAPGLTSVK